MKTLITQDDLVFIGAVVCIMWAAIACICLTTAHNYDYNEGITLAEIEELHHD